MVEIKNKRFQDYWNKTFRLTWKNSTFFGFSIYPNLRLQMSKSLKDFCRMGKPVPAQLYSLCTQGHILLCFTHVHFESLHWSQRFMDIVVWILFLLIYVGVNRNRIWFRVWRLLRDASGWWKVLLQAELVVSSMFRVAWDSPLEDPCLGWIFYSRYLPRAAAAADYY